MPSTDCKIFILTGKIHCGKSRTLGRFLSEKKEEGKVVKGLLNPSIDSEKWFLNLCSEDVFSAEKMGPNDSPISIGPYIFSVQAFEKAKGIISQNITEKIDFFAIDELGILEMRGEGLEPAISEFLAELPNKPIKNLILIIRDSLVSEAKTAFGLKSAKVIAQTDLFKQKWA